MASLNDYKLVDIKSKKYFDLLASSRGIKNVLDKQKCRMGFYLFILENYTGVTDVDELVEFITDTDFNRFLFDEKVDDCGIDAVYIEEETKVIKLFNFK